jgi:hypothetical protein
MPTGLYWRIAIQFSTKTYYSQITYWWIYNMYIYIITYYSPRSASSCVRRKAHMILGIWRETHCYSNSNRTRYHLLEANIPRKAACSLVIPRQARNVIKRDTEMSSFVRLQLAQGARSLSTEHFQHLLKKMISLRSGSHSIWTYQVSHVSSRPSMTIHFHSSFIFSWRKSPCLGNQIIYPHILKGW